ncbi:MAG TPA: peptidylprolyl isomerase [Patescibacteria group bacterium]|jgi:cyclophilin family peptidyl-prolyl cis-trans isomerase|nr:peptidylprolyl isomerase [Patescibacteria group bacterium]
MKTWQIYSLVAVVVVVGIGAAIFLTKHNKNNNETKDSTSSTQTQTPADAQENSNTATQNANTATTAGQCNRSVNNKVMQDKIDIKNKFVTLSVEGYGDIKVQLYDADAPKTVENFLRLTASGYYDCLTFHRIAKGFVIQGGDPTGTGSGGDSAFGGEFADELNPNTPSAKAGYQKGVLAMANRGPNTNTSQFFIMLDNNDLPFNYTIFGKVVAGQDVVDKIGQAPITPQMGPTDGSPVNKITITKATIN